MTCAGCDHTAPCRGCARPGGPAPCGATSKILRENPAIGGVLASVSYASGFLFFPNDALVLIAAYCTGDGSLTGTMQATAQEFIFPVDGAVLAIAAAQGLGIPFAGLALTIGKLAQKILHSIAGGSQPAANDLSSLAASLGVAAQATGAGMTQEEKDNLAIERFCRTMISALYNPRITTVDQVAEVAKASLIGTRGYVSLKAVQIVEKYKARPEMTGAELLQLMNATWHMTDHVGLKKIYLELQRLVAKYDAIANAKQIAADRARAAIAARGTSTAGTAGLGIGLPLAGLAAYLAFR